MPMFCIFDHANPFGALSLDLTPHDPLDELTAAITAIEAHLVGHQSAAVPCADVVRLFVASTALLATPGRSAALPPAFVAWFAEHRPLCAEWGLVIRDDQPWEVETATTLMQLGLFPHLSRIFLRSMLEGWHQMAVPAAA